MPRFTPKWGKVLLLETKPILDQVLGPDNWFLMLGTALGAYRDKGFVPTEEDIDVGVILKDRNVSLESLLTRFVQSNFCKVEIVIAPFSICRILYVHKYQIKMDIVGWLAFNEELFAATPVEPEHVLKPYCLVHSRKVLSPPYRKIELFGEEFNVPQDIEKYLELEYGTDWRTPKEDHISRTRIYSYLSKNGISNHE